MNKNKPLDQNAPPLSKTIISIEHIFRSNYTERRKKIEQKKCVFHI